MGSDWQARLVAAGALVLAGLAGIWFGAGAPAEPDVDVHEPPPTTAPPPAPTMVVHVSGWVEEPGLVAVPAGARVADAVAAAGGARAGADLTALNLAEPLADGQQVLVPGPGDTRSAAAGGQGDGRIRLNQADVSELESLPGVGPVLARRIVEHRERHGPFAVIEDLLDVPGIGEVKLASLRDLVIVP